MVEKKCIYKKWIAVFTAFMITCVFSAPAIYAQTESTLLSQSHWATPYLEAFIKQGILQGPLESCEPNRPITYAEFAKMSTSLFHYNKPSTVSFSDVKPDDWYAKSISYAAGQGFFEGKQGKALPNDSMTRADAAVMIGKMLKYDTDTTTSYMDACVAKGYFVGDLNGDILSQKQLTRAEATRLLYAVSGEVYSQQGTYNLNNKTIKSNVTITTDGVALKNAVIEGDLYITEGVGVGDVTLDNIEVKGETIVSGGGMDSIVFINTKIGRLKVDVPDGTPVRIVASADSSINMTAVRSECKLQDEQVTGNGFKEIVIYVPELAKVSLDGNFESVTVDSPNTKLDILGGEIGNITVAKEAKDADIKLASKVTVSELTANTEAKIGGTGKINNATITSPGVTIAQKPNNVSVSQGMTAKVNNNTVTGSTNNMSSGGSGSGGDSGSSGGDSGSSGGDSGSSGGDSGSSGGDSGSSGGDSGSSGGDSGSSGEDSGSSGEDSGSSGGDSGTGTDDKSKELTYQSVELEQKNSTILVRIKFDEVVAFYVNDSLASSADIASAFNYQGKDMEGNVYTSVINEGKTVEFTVSETLKPGNYQIRFNQTLATQNWELKGINSNAKFLDLKGIVIPFKIEDTQKPPFTLTGLENMSVFEGETATFSVTTDSSLNLEFQWYRDGVSIEGATNDSYTFVTGMQDNGATFLVKAWITVDGIKGETVESSVVILTVKPKSDTGDTEHEVSTELSSLSIQGKGILENLNFDGFVPSTIEVQTKPTTDSIKIQVGTSSEDVAVSVITKQNPTDEGSALSASPTEPNTFLVPCDANMQYKEIIITVSLKSNPTKQSKYSIIVINNSPLIVTGNGYFLESDIPLKVDGTGDMVYWIRYLKPQEKFTGIGYYINSDENGTEELFDEEFEIVTMPNGIVQVTIFKEFIDYWDVGDEITFVFTFSGGTVGEKVSKIEKIASSTPEDDKEIGKVTLGNVQFVEERTSTDITNKVWLKIFLPLYVDGNPASYSETQGDGSYLKLIFYEDGKKVAKNVQPIFNDATINGEKGVTFTIEHRHFYHAVLADQDLIIDSVAVELIDKDRTLIEATDKLELMDTQFTSETFEFKHDKNTTLIDTLSPEFNKDIYDYTLTLENIKWPVSYAIIENGSKNKISYMVFTNGRWEVKDQDGKEVLVFADTEKKEEIFYFIPFNSKPFIYTFDFKGSSLLTGTQIITYSSEITGNYFYQVFNSLTNAYGTIKDLKEHSLDLDNTTYTIGTRGDGSPLQISLQEFFEKIYGDSLSDSSSIRTITISDMQTWFDLFDFNPYTDSMGYNIEVKSVLREDSLYKPCEQSVSLTGNGGSLSKIKFQNTNDTTEGKIITIPSENIDMDVVLPYSEVSILTTSTSNYNCVVYDKEGVPLDEKALILQENIPTDIAIVVGNTLMRPKVYKFHLTYEPASQTNMLLQETPEKQQENAIDGLEKPKEEIAQSADTELKEEIAQSADVEPKEEIAQLSDAGPKEEIAPAADAEPKEEIAQSSDAEPKEEIAPAADAELKKEIAQSADMNISDASQQSDL